MIKAKFITSISVNDVDEWIEADVVFDENRAKLTGFEASERTIERVGRLASAERRKLDQVLAGEALKLYLADTEWFVATKDGIDEICSS